jgi:ribokinase/sulfofructose kinase
MIVFCGYANRDIVIQLDELPGVGERRQARFIRQHDGGMAANAAVAAARFGATPTFAGVVGPDAESLDFLAGLRREGVSTDWTRTDAYLTHAVILLDDNGERAVISQDDALTVDDLRRVLNRLDRTQQHWVYVDGYRWDSFWVPTNAPAALVVDVDGCTEAVQVIRAARAAQHLIGSSRIFNDACGFTIETLEQLAATEGTTIVVTRGAQGLTVLEPGRQARQIPVRSVSVTDDTGAGDCFAGVYLAELARGASAVHAATTGAAAATLSCRHPGSRAAPTRRELTDFLELH